MVSSQSGIETTIEVELFNTLGWSHLVFGIDMMNLLAEGDSGRFLGFSGEGRCSEVFSLVEDSLFGKRPSSSQFPGSLDVPIMWLTWLRE